jgi:hypothetical protein
MFLIKLLIGYSLINIVYVVYEATAILSYDDDMLTYLYFESIKDKGLRYWHITVAVLFFPAIFFIKSLGISFKYLICPTFEYIIIPVFKYLISLLNKPVLKKKRSDK